LPTRHPSRHSRPAHQGSYGFPNQAIQRSEMYTFIILRALRAILTVI
jgi:hypothetical protein